MENLSRGVVAVRCSETDVLISWRLLGLDPKDIGFNVYRTTDDGSPERLNREVLTKGTNFVDDSADLDRDNIYEARAVIGGKEQAADSHFTLPAANPQEPVVRVPLREGGPIKFVWVGDLDGDGNYDYVLDRQTVPQTLEAYTSTGKFLWEIQLGPGSEEQNNISPGPSTIDVGHWDGVTVYDFDSDGHAEVAIRIANGVVFGDGQTFRDGDNDNHQFIAFVDGMTGALRASAELPNKYSADGPLGARFGVGYLDGKRPHLISYNKNRQKSGAFNLLYAAYTFDGRDANLEWIWHRDNTDAPDGHNSRSFDSNGDGKDEIHEIGFCLNGDGTFRYKVEDAIHGDRFQIAKIDPSRDGYQGFAVQQNHPDFLYEIYYDADDGKAIWKHYGEGDSDVGRGLVGDLDPRHPGMESWSFSGLYNTPKNVLVDETSPWPHLTLFWDGDIQTELFNDGKIEKWNPATANTDANISRLVTTWRFNAAVTHGPNPAMIGDIFGDWREEVILVHPDQNALAIFTTDQPTDIRLYTFAHNPAYRNSMTFKGYIQTHNPDYFVGNGMKSPPRPNIRYV